MYKFLPKRLSNFFRYVNKVYGFSKILNSMKDKRPDAELTPQNIFLSAFICCLLRFGSLSAPLSREYIEPFGVRSKKQKTE